MNGVLTSCGVKNRSNLSLHLGNKGHSLTDKAQASHAEDHTHM
jgi:hypothetical protein